MIKVVYARISPIFLAMAFAWLLSVLLISKTITVFDGFATLLFLALAMLLFALGEDKAQLEI